jgi:multidrug efflux pump subunit AcrA (membrane-fusion protein)
VLRADALPGQILMARSAKSRRRATGARSYRVRVKLDDPSQLKVGMTVDANLIVAERANALLVPTTAIQNNAVWTINEGRLHRQPVRIGVTGAGRTEIVEGVTPDARIVDSPAPDVRECRGVRLRPPPDAANK